MVVALALIAAIGDIERFAKPEQLVGYLGLNPSVRQSGPGPAYHGRITKQGRGHARGMLVEAGWAAARSPGPLRSFFLRVQGRRGQHVAAVATARKLAILIWHLLTKHENYLWSRPALHARKLRYLELKAGHKSARGQKGTAHAYNLKSQRDQERRWVEQGETAYARLWQVGTQEGRWRARVPQRRSDNRAARQDFHLVPCLFATRSSVRDSRLASSEARRQPSVAPCSGWSRPSRLRRWAAASIDHPCARRHPKWQAGTEKRLASAKQRNCLSITSVVCGLLVLVRL